MRIAAIYDIHANLSALEAVLQEIRQVKVDCVVVGGDVLPGPLPSETIQCLLDLDIPKQLSTAMVTARCSRRCRAWRPTGTALHPNSGASQCVGPCSN